MGSELANDDNYNDDNYNDSYLKGVCTKFPAMRKLIIIAHLLLPGIVNAATAVTRYVNTDCANNGDGTASTCAASAGAAGAYTTFDNSVTDIVADYPNMVSSDVQVTVDLRGAAADTSNPNITGTTTDATRYLRFVVDQSRRHDGKWNTGVYRLVNNGYSGALLVNESFVRLEGLQVEQTRTGAGAGTPAGGIKVQDSGSSGDIRVENCILRYTGDYTNQVENYGIYDADAGSSQVLIVRNNIVYDFDRNLLLRTGTSDVTVAYNNTLVDGVTEGFSYRLYGSGATFYMKNNLVQGSATNYNADGSSGATLTSATNLSEDASSPNSANRSKVITFVNEGSNDFHLDSGETDAVDAGTDLSGDTYSFSTDIDGATRSGTWDIGADEITAAAVKTLSVLNAMGEL